MKSVLFLIAGITGAVAYMIAKQNRSAATTPSAAAAPVEDLAHRLQDAWADHHTVA